MAAVFGWYLRRKQNRIDRSLKIKNRADREMGDRARAFFKDALQNLPKGLQKQSLLQKSLNGSILR